MRVAVVVCGLFVVTSASADPLIPGPGQAGHDASLATLAGAYDRQFHIFNAAPFGLSLDAFVPAADDRARVQAFLAQSATDDFAAFTASMGTRRTVEDIMRARGEYGDLGMFGGVAALADAFRYAIWRDTGAPAGQVDTARQELIEAIDSFHVYANITGHPGTIARGIRRVGEVGPPVVPLPPTCPDAWDREDTWRADASGNYPNWEWRDNTSKDQMLGYVMAIGAFWDVVAEDPTIPQRVKDNLQADAVAIGRSLMEPVEVRANTRIDLVIRDYRGCRVRFHDLNPREVIIDGASPLVLAEDSTRRIGFNALAALGIIRTLYHISGDDMLRRFYYDELITNRNYPMVVESGVARLRNMFANACVGNNCVVTNFSNVNMAVTGIYGVLRYETDASLRTIFRRHFEDELWSGPRPHMLSVLKQPFFHLIYNAYRTGGASAQITADAVTQLGQWPTPPYFQEAVINCDPAEITAGQCLAVDGQTVIRLDDNQGRGGRDVAEDALDKRIRPRTNFEWRDDPRFVNAGPGDRLNPGGDFRAAYWLGRFLENSTNQDANVSPVARNRDGSGGPMPPPPPVDAGQPAVDAGQPAMDAATPPTDAADASPMPADAGAAVDAGTVQPDSGVPAPDATAVDDSGVSATRDAEFPDAGSVAEDDSGCGCASAPMSSAPRGGLFWLLAGAFVLRRFSKKSS